VKASRFLAALALAGSLAGTVTSVAAAPNKCVVNGTVTYQQGPCPSGEVRKQPTLEELNAAEKQRRAAAVATKADQVSAAPRSTPTSSTTPSPATAAPAAKPGDYRCDGRQYCSQMKSCAEAKYFLLNCPGAKMDGDRNGIPCEKQWCDR
jgi:hypothetical protein